MESVTLIQDTVDMNKEAMPTGVVVTVQKECQKLYDIHSNMYWLTWTMVDSHDCAEVKLTHKTQTLIVEAVKHLPDHPNGHDKMSAMDLPHNGMVCHGWVDHFTKQASVMPMVLMPTYGRSDCMVIIHSIKPHLKRTREA